MYREEVQQQERPYCHLRRPPLNTQQIARRRHNSVDQLARHHVTHPTRITWW